jgi:hypothetical protein
VIVGFEGGALQRELVKSQDQSGQIFGAFAKLQKATTSFVTPVCPSILLHGTTRLPQDGFL